MSRMLSFLLAATLLILPACHVGRFFIYNFADLHDDRKFPARPVARAGTPFQFRAAAPQSHLRLPKAVTLDKKEYTFDELLKKTGTVAFLVIRHDTILTERYLEGYDAASAVPSFSVAKSVTSALVGVAVGEGLIKSIDEPIITYLPELDQKAFAPITLRHLLQMRSGIRYNESYFNPFGDVAKYYYGRRITKYLHKLKVKEAPDQHFEYVSINPQLLGLIVARATKHPLAQYLQEKLWQPMGMEFDASWSLDRKGGVEKAFCCLNARARDFARFGRLYLHHGAWQGRQLVPRAWVDASVYDATTQAPNNFLYSYQWWHNRRFEAYSADTTRHGAFRTVPGSSLHFTPGSAVPDKLTVRPAGDFFAEGILGQYIYVNPAKDFILVRLGRKDNFNWAQLGLQLAQYSPR